MRSAAIPVNTISRTKPTDLACWSIDLALPRRLPLGAARNVELRVETFNLLNRFNWGNPGPPLGSAGNANIVNFDAGNFGQIATQAGTPRVGQGN